MRKSTIRYCLISALLALFIDFAAIAQEDEIAAEPAIKARLADQSLLLDAIKVNDALIAVGERGHVLISASGQSWSQANQVPVRSTLTRITASGRRLWAVGHDAAIISSMDGGLTWFVQHFEPEAQEPLLDVVFVDPSRGYAIGAYGRFMSTRDGGINWQVERIAERVTSEAIDWAALAGEQDGYETLPDDFEFSDGTDDMVDKGCFEFLECHLNAILNYGDGRMMIVAERGYGYRSEDSGQTWESFRFPYSGSMFGLVRQNDCIVAFGLRGHAQKSCDFGHSWEGIETGTTQSLMGATVTDDGRVLMVGSGSTRLVLHPDGRIESDADRMGSDYAAVVIANGATILVGEDGVRHE
ncbi:MAG: hypothetical protein LC637_00595 [Xanthomonadaceae bacterium]|nr:hypothetical protein [Xanthomonadaceae bacterium]